MREKLERETLKRNPRPQNQDRRHHGHHRKIDDPFAGDASRLKIWIPICGIGKYSFRSPTLTAKLKEELEKKFKKRLKEDERQHKPKIKELKQVYATSTWEFRKGSLCLASRLRINSKDYKTAEKKEDGEGRCISETKSPKETIVKANHKSTYGRFFWCRRPKWKRWRFWRSGFSGSSVLVRVLRVTALPAFSLPLVVWLSHEMAIPRLVAALPYYRFSHSVDLSFYIWTACNTKLDLLKLQISSQFSGNFPFNSKNLNPLLDCSGFCLPEYVCVRDEKKNIMNPLIDVLLLLAYFSTLVDLLCLYDLSNCLNIKSSKLIKTLNKERVRISLKNLTQMKDLNKLTDNMNPPTEPYIGTTVVWCDKNLKIFQNLAAWESCFSFYRAFKFSCHLLDYDYVVKRLPLHYFDISNNCQRFERDAHDAEISFESQIACTQSKFWDNCICEKWLSNPQCSALFLVVLDLKSTHKYDLCLDPLITSMNNQRLDQKKTQGMICGTLRKCNPDCQFEYQLWHFFLSSYLWYIGMYVALKVDFMIKINGFCFDFLAIWKLSMTRRKPRPNKIEPCTNLLIAPEICKCPVDHRSILVDKIDKVYEPTKCSEGKLQRDQMNKTEMMIGSQHNISLDTRHKLWLFGWDCLLL